MEDTAYEYENTAVEEQQTPTELMLIRANNGGWIVREFKSPYEAGQPVAAYSTRDEMLTGLRTVIR